LKKPQRQLQRSSRPRLRGLSKFTSRSRRTKRGATSKSLLSHERQACGITSLSMLNVQAPSVMQCTICTHIVQCLLGCCFRLHSGNIAEAWQGYKSCSTTYRQGNKSWSGLLASGLVLTTAVASKLYSPMLLFIPHNVLHNPLLHAG
jgi:hypothetical protein